MSVVLGAAPSEWQHFAYTLGAREDLLPVVANPNATISPLSSLKELGKVPSLYNAQGMARGMPQWTKHVASDADIATWSQHPDLGICLQTKRLRAIDVDINDPRLAKQITDFWVDVLGPTVPIRTRANSARTLLLFDLVGHFPKRTFTVGTERVEFLGTGSQFVALSTHPSGARYEWAGGLPSTIPSITAETFENACALFEFSFTTGDTSTDSTRKLGEDLQLDDARADYLIANGLATGEDADGSLYVDCPWKHEHTTDSGPTETIYMPAGTKGYGEGNFKCMHAHCADRNTKDFLTAVEYPWEAEDFDTYRRDIRGSKWNVELQDNLEPDLDTDFLIEDYLSQDGTTILYGASNVGKSFIAIDMAYHIATGKPWNGKYTQKSSVLYIAAEAGTSIKKRFLALHKKHSDNKFPVGLIASPISLRGKSTDADQIVIDAARLAKVTKTPVRLIVIDTLNRAMQGGNENASEDMGEFMAQVDKIRSQTKAHVLIVHHSGKDSSKGARGHSSLRAAVDHELEVIENQLTVCKQRDDGFEKPLDFQLEVVDVYVNRRGKQITSCVVKWSPTGAASAANDFAALELDAGDQEFVSLVYAAARAKSGDGQVHQGQKLRHIELWKRYVAGLPELVPLSPEYQKHRRRHDRGIDQLVVKGILSAMDKDRYDLLDVSAVGEVGAPEACENAAE